MILVVVTVILVLILILTWVPRRAVSGYSLEDDDYIEPEVFTDVITEDEKNYILQQAESRFARSGVVGSSEPSDVRTSETAWLDKSDPIVGPMMRRICDRFDVPFENSEQLQVVRYKPGTYYREHHDSCCDEGQACEDFAAQSGQRIRTILVYLNNEFTGGETNFPSLGLKLKAEPKGAIVFYPMDNVGKNMCHPKALHAGLPVESGEKYICNIWIREKPT